MTPPPFDALCKALDVARDVLAEEGVDVRCVVLAVGVGGGNRVAVNWPREAVQASAQLCSETAEALSMQAMFQDPPL